MNISSALSRNTRLQAILLICTTDEATPTRIAKGSGYAYRHALAIISKLRKEGYIEKARREGRHTFYSTTSKGKDLIVRKSSGRYFVIMNTGERFNYG